MRFVASVALLLLVAILDVAVAQTDPPCVGIVKVFKSKSCRAGRRKKDRIQQKRLFGVGDCVNITTDRQASVRGRVFGTRGCGIQLTPYPCPQPDDPEFFQTVVIGSDYFDTIYECITPSGQNSDIVRSAMLINFT